MNATPDSLAPPTADAAPAETVGETPEPVRRRRAARPKAEAGAAEGATAGSAPAEVGEPVAAGVDAPTEDLAPDPAEPGAKPRRRRASATPPAASDEVAAPSTGASVVPAEASTAPDVEAPAAAATATADVAPPAVEPPRTAADGSDGGDDGDGDNTADIDAGGEGGPRGRNRNRRDRKRGEGREPATAMTPEAVAPRAGELFEQVVSGRFDIAGEPSPDAPAEPEAADDTTGADPSRRVLLPEPDAPKLHKVLAQSGIGSRRDMEDAIADGRVSVNGEPAHVGQRVSFGDRVQLDGKPVKLRIVPAPPRIVAYHKPVGEIVTHDDPQNRPTVFRRLPRLKHGKWQSVGRLDINTEGLLLFTTSGELANQLMHPRFGVEREYAVRLLGTLTEEQKAKLLAGIEVDGQPAAFASIVDGGGDGANHWYRVVITEGRNREVRKLFDAVGLTVSRLIRIRYGTVVLPLGLKRGVWVDLEEGDVRAIRRLAAPPQAQQGGDRAGPRPEARQGGAGRPQDGRQGPPGPRADRPNGRPNDRPNDRTNERRHPDRPAAAGAPPMPVSRPPGERDGDDDLEIDFDPASIPNPLEQTFDKRFVSNPRSSIGGRGFRQGGGGFGAGGSAPAQKRGPANGPKQPDPLQTSLGVFGADAFHRKNRGGGGQGGGGQGGGGQGGGYRGGNGNRGGGQGGGGQGGGGYGPGGGRRGR